MFTVSRMLTDLFKYSFVFLAVGFLGCGSGKYPVNGTVTLEDGTPLERGLLVFERFEGGLALTSRSSITSGGKFELSTDVQGDGCPVGKYRAAINPLDLSDLPDEKKVLPFDNKYLNINESGLEFEVKPGENRFQIKLVKKREKAAASP